MSLGDDIRAARKARGLTLAKVADAVGVSVPYVSDIERGNRPMPPARREAFARVLGLPVERLTPLDADTLAVAIDALQAAGGCDRAVWLLRELGGGQ